VGLSIEQPLVEMESKGRLLEVLSSRLLTLVYEEGRQPGAGCDERRREACGPGTDDGNIDA
jgi:hypothetical protein